jgi:hypothetical protein
MSVIINESQFPKFVHEQIHTRAGGADHFRLRSQREMASRIENACAPWGSLPSARADGHVGMSALSDEVQVPATLSRNASQACTTAGGTAPRGIPGDADRLLSPSLAAGSSSRARAGAVAVEKPVARARLIVFVLILLSSCGWSRNARLEFQDCPIKSLFGIVHHTMRRGRSEATTDSCGFGPRSASHALASHA